MDKIASQIKVLLLFGMVGVNEVGIRWKDNALSEEVSRTLQIVFFTKEAE